MRWQRLLFTLFLGLAIVGAKPLFGQVDAGAIRGTVTDSSGAVIPNVQVSLTNEGTGLTVSTTTGTDGTYTFSPVRIGSYTVKVAAKGFKESTTHLVVTVQEQARADFKLVPGGANEQVVVTAEAPQLQTQEASVGLTASEKQITDLPLNGRNYTFLAQLGAGVTSLAPTRGMDQTGSFVANGLSTVHNNYILDGIDNNNDTVDFLNGAAYVNLPPPDAIQEFRVQTSNFSAEFGRAGGAVVNATIKSGTNQFHGTVWEFLRNDALDALGLDEYFFPADQKKKETLKRNQFGVAAGGPILKNKWFIFGDYEGTRIRSSISRIATVPTDLERNSNFTDFRDIFGSTTATAQDVLGRTFSTATILDPATTRPVTAGQVDPVTGLVATATGYVRDPFYTNGSVAGITNFTGLTQFLNQLPANRLDQTAIALLNLYPAANVSGAIFDNYKVLRSQPDDNNHFDIRSDFNFSTKDQMFGRISYSKRHANFPGSFTGIADNSGFGQGDFNDKSWNLAISESHAFSPTLINEVRFGYSKLNTTAEPPNANTTGIPDQVGIPGIPQGSGNGGLPTIEISGLTSMGAGAFASPNRRGSDTIQFTENLTKVHGGHSFKGGFEYQRLHFPWVDPAWSRGDFSFGGYTGVPAGVTSGVGMADILLTPIDATVTNGVNNVGGANTVFASNITQPDDLRNYYGAYFQDDWKATPKLTVNMGLRWEVFGQITESAGKQAGLLPGDLNGSGAEWVIISQQKNKTPLSSSFTDLLQQDGIGLVYRDSIMDTPMNNFAPRVGLAYQLTNRLVARAGYGIFYGGFENLGGAPDPGYNYPFTVNLGFFRPNDVSPLFYADGKQATLENGLTSATPDPDSPNFVANGLGLVGYQKDWKTAYTQEWNATLQYQIASNQTVSIGYVGSNSQHLLNGNKRNLPTVILPPGTDQTPYLPFPDFGRNSDYVSADGSSLYKGLQLSYEHRFAHGLNLLVNFTRSICKTDNKNILGISDGLFMRAPTLPGRSIKEDYAWCGSDVPRIFHVSGIYELPIGKGKALGGGMSSWADAVVGGWSTQWIYTLQDGFPFAIGCAQSTTANYGCWANVVQGKDVYADVGPHGTTQFLDPAAFATPPIAATVGQSDTAPLGGFPTQGHGPGYNNLDFSLFKQFRTTEKTHLEFRSEFFNALNHPNFANSFVTTDYRNTAQFGQINGVRGIGRQIQMALKFYW